MKKLVFISVIAGLGAAGSVFAAPSQVNFQAVNPVLQAVADAALIADENVEFAYPTFDPAQSNLNDGIEKLKYDLKAQLKNTPWLTGGSAQIEGTSTYLADRNPQHLGVAVTLNTTATTDIFALIRYAANLALKKRQHVDPKFDARIDAHLTRLSITKSLDDVYEILWSAHAIAAEKIQAQVTQTQQSLQCLQTPACHDPADPQLGIAIQQHQQDLALWQSIQTQIAALALDKLLDTQGKVTEIRLGAASIEQMLCGHKHPLSIDRTTLTFAATTLKMENQSFYSLSQARLDELKTNLEAKLVGLQNNSAPDKAYVEQQTFRAALIEFKRALHGENIK